MRPSVELNIKPDREPHKKMQSVVSPPDRPIAYFKFKSRQWAMLTYMHLNYISTHQGSFLQLTSKPYSEWREPHHRKTPKQGPTTIPKAGATFTF